jgi:uncharacterized protein involved in exopolysaccharide biosynthesis
MKKQPISIVEHKEAKAEAQKATLTELETARIKLAIAQANEAQARAENLKTQLAAAQSNYRFLLAKTETLRNEILRAYGFTPADGPDLEISESDELITISRKA